MIFELRKYYYPFLLIFLMLLSCKVKEKIGHNQGDSDKQYVYMGNSPDSLLIYNDPFISKIWSLDKDTLLNCPGSPHPLTFDHKEKVLIRNFPTNYAYLLLDSAFYGNKDAENLLLLRMLSKKSYKKVPVSKARGEKIFALNLHYLNDFSFLPDGDPYYGKNNYARNARRVYNMIRDINGLRATVWAAKQMESYGYSKFEIAEMLANEDVNYYKLEYKALKHAWKENLINLKDYGEE